MTPLTLHKLAEPALLCLPLALPPVGTRMAELEQLTSQRHVWNQRCILSCLHVAHLAPTAPKTLCFKLPQARPT